MQIPGGEKYLAPDAEDEAPDCDHDGATLLSMAEGGFPGQYACSRCGMPFRPTIDLAGDEAEEDVEIDEELEISGAYDDLRILEIPLAPERKKNLLGFDYDVPRYAVLGVPKIAFVENDRRRIQRILNALVIDEERDDG